MYIIVIHEDRPIKCNWDNKSYKQILQPQKEMNSILVINNFSKMQWVNWLICLPVKLSYFDRHEETIKVF